MTPLKKLNLIFAAAAISALLIPATASGQGGSKAGETKVMGDITFVWCPPGKFMMGSPATEADREGDEIQHEVTLSTGFWIAKTETSQTQWKAVLGAASNPSEWSGSGDFPVEKTHWGHAIQFCAAMNEKFARDLPEGWKFTLPTEAQWEYACRAGTTTAYAFGEVIQSTQANFDGTRLRGAAADGVFLEKTVKVDAYQPNAWGIYNMHGNVAEWCMDGYVAYTKEAITDPAPPATGLYRILRGGSWRSEAPYLRSAFRSRPLPELELNNIGFRVVVSPAK